MYRKLKFVIPAVLFILFAIIQYYGLIPAINNIIHDNVFISSRPVHDNIIIVGIDTRSLDEIGSWPWPRFFMAEAITQLSEMGAAVIGINVLYDTPSAFPEYDDALVSAAFDADHLVLGGEGVLDILHGDRALLEIEYFRMPFGELADAATVGFLNAIQDADGVKRRSLTSMRYGDITVHSFPFEIYRTYRRTMGQEVRDDIPLDSNGQLPIKYVDGPGSFTTVSFWGVINGFYPSAMFSDAIVLIGPYAHGIGGGNFPTPMDRSVTTHGIEIYANIIQGFLEGVFIVDAPWWLNMALLALSGVIVALLFYWLRPLSALVITAVLIIALLVGARFLYDHFYLIVRIGDIIVFLLFCYLANLTLGIMSTQYEKQHIRGLFSRFVAPEVVEEIISGNVEVQLGGVVKEITALFVDIRGFTAFSEANPPEKVVDMINRYLGLTSRSIQENSGTIDKFIGDATMALFNAPNDVPNHALCAVKAAWAMKQGSVALHKEILEEYGVDLQFGIGINTGTAVVGNMGSDFRMDYTAIGDAINTAARLESSAAKGQIIISDATYQQVKQHVKVNELGVINVKNKKTGILTYDVIDVW